ncbi:sulfurtransferase [Microbacterium sp. 18062]|uniref:sulfurtransferase n=1 Tax=Microbacterium sp. 18062 TaxID=2681410 RepID=UPI00135702BD|nr:rhodanese-like domain-containing protein [Microbacterium sp. 18062]
MARFPLLITADDLAGALGDDSVVIADVRTRYIGQDVAPDHDRYLAGHIPGAVFADLAGAFSTTAPDGRQFVLPDAELFAAAAGALGAGAGRHLVVYTEGWQIWATRLWWLFRYFGFDDVSVLDGGYQSWVAEQRPVERGETAPHPVVFTARPRPELVADLADVERISTGAADGQLVNALPEKLFTGEVPTHGTVSGRIPRSVNIPWPVTAALDTARYAPVAEIRAAADATLQPDGDVVAYCGAGVSATGLVFGLALAGRDDIRLYDGSLDEWGALGKPLATGAPSPQE